MKLRGQTSTGSRNEMTAYPGTKHAVQRAVHALGGSKTAEWMMRKTPLGRVSKRFVPGETTEALFEAVRPVAASGLGVTVNYLGEEEKTAEAASEACAVYRQLVERLAAEGVPGGISLKFSQLGQAIGDDVLMRNLEPLLCAARERAVFLRFDMESSAYTQRTLDAFDGLWDAGWRGIGVVLQAYLFRTEADVERMNERGVGVRLCKGAYDEPSSVAYQSREDVSQSFVRCMKLLLRKGNYPGIATHDEGLIRATVDFARDQQIGPDRFEFQMLYGVRRDLQQQLLNDGYKVRVYIPFGRSWYPYLMRRLAERPANMLFLLGSVVQESRLKFLLRSPT